MLRCKPQTNPNAPRRDGELSMLRLKPLAQAIALLMVAGNAHAATAFSSAWFAAKGASQAGGTGRPTTAAPGMPPPLAQQQRANAQLQRSLTNLNNTVAAIAAQQAAQAAGRQAAFGQVQVVPDGLGEGGLKVDNSLTQGWLNAKGPQQTQDGGKTTVKIEQTADKAILNWETFNVGRNTTVDFQQQSDWAVLNRVNDPQARPSQIQGQIKGNGTVMLVNRNGIIFSGSSQVNVRNLAAVAANISDEQFSKRGLYVDATGSQPTFTDAAGKVEVQQGALIETHRAATSTAGGGYALLLGSEVENAGSIITAKGQTTLAAGDSFYIRRGQGTSGNLRSTTRGNEVATSLKPGSSAGTVINSGLIQASTGDITLSGHNVQQNGVAVASSSVDTRGTVHLLNAFNDSTGSVTLGQGSATAVLLDAAGGSALDSQYNAGPAGLDGTPNNLITGRFNNLSSVVDRTDQSRVEIVSGGSVDFQNGSITLATGGQVAVSAAGRSLVRDGAVIDVSGAIGVKVAMESNSIKVNVQGNEQRDAPVNREDGKLTNNDVWVDVRDLIYVPAGTNGYATDRWYTAGGLLEVGGYLGTRGHSAGEWAAQGGTLTFTGNDVVTQQAAQLNLSGGTLDVQSGYLRQSWLKGPNGRLYELSKAPGDILYTGIYKGYEDHSQRWGQTNYYYNPLIAPRERFEAGYTVGRDAGKLVVSTRNAVLEGQIVGEVYQGERQTQAPNLNLDGYQQSQNAVARRAQLWVGSYTPIYDKISGVINSGLNPTLDQVTVGKVADKIAASLDLTSVVGSDRQGKLVLDNTLLNGFQLGAVKVAAAEGIKVDGMLKVADGGDITLYAPQVDVNADLTARGGRIALGNVLKQVRTDNFKIEDVVLSPAVGQRAKVTLAEGVTLDTAGRWSNLLLDGADRQGLPFINGGSVSVRSGGDIDVRQGSVIDVSSGAAVMADGKTRGGKGGDLTLTAGLSAFSDNGALNLEGELRGTGVSGGGTLKLAANKVLIGDSGSPLEPGTLQLDGDFFNKGFSAYDITGNEGLTVAEGTRVDVTMPVYRFGVQALTTGGNAEPADVLQRWTPELYQEDAIKGILTQRRGASLSLTAGTANSSAAEMATTVLNLGKGSVISVDPGQGIDVRSIGQLTANGTLNAWGGRVSLTELSVNDAVRDQVNAQGHGRSIWLGEQALIDVSSRAVTARDMRGQVYGLVRDGGQIIIGGQIDAAKGTTSASELFVVVRDGARLQADGSQAVLDISGQGRTLVASNGGSISLASANGLYLGGDLNARSGGTGAAGGSLSVALETPYYLRSAVDGRVLNVRELVLEQVARDIPLGDTAEASADLLVYGHGRIGVDQFQAGGFDRLSLLSNGLMSVDGNLSMSLGQSLSLYARSFGLSATAPASTRVELNAPHVLLSAATGLAATRPSFDPYTRPVVDGGGVLPSSNQAVFSVNADLLDVQGSVMFSSKGSVRQADGSTVGLERAGFDQVQLNSRGDLRFLAGFSNDGLPTGFTTQLVTPSDMVLQAAQLYPATGVGARVLAGWSVVAGGIPQYDSLRSLVIGRTGQTTPQAPYSAFGRLQLGSARIEQGGVVRAPLGLIEIGTNGGPGEAITDRINLLPSSLTSVSGAGLVMPYGGTVDGQSYQYAGKKVVLLGQGAVPSDNGDLNIGVILGGKSVAAQGGAVLDLSGGGELLGAGFISGRGGSTDARFNPLVQIGANGGFTLPGLSSNPVYAIVPGNQSQYAPVAPEGGAVDPRVGQQITIGAGVPGLAAGTYTLMPSTYALLPGAFRVEVNGLAGQGSAIGAQRMRNGSWTTAGVLSVANTGQRNSLSSQVILTSGDVLRRYSQYNETSYAQFAVADAARLGVPRALLPVDAKTLKLNLAKGAGDQAFSFKGIGKFAPQAGGDGGTVAVVASNGTALEVVAEGRGATAGFEGVTLNAESLNALNASRQVIGGQFSVLYGQGGNYITPMRVSRSVALREGATLSAPEVFLLADGGELLVEQGAAINTIGRGKAAYDAGDGFIYNFNVRNRNYSSLAVSNGLLNVLAPVSSTLGTVNIGGCSLTPCSGVTRIHSEGSIVAATGGSLELDDRVRYGTRHLTLALSNINVGTAQALSNAATRQVLPAGLTLSQTVLDRLLRGDTEYGAPALETLELSASQALNFYGTVSLDTFDPTTGKSRLSNLMLTTPAIYGAGSANDVATIRTANLIWNGAVGAPGSVIAGGAGTGAGRLDIQAQRIEFGYGDFAQPSSVTTLDRLALGFANVNLSASERLTANHKGSLAVYQSQGAYDAKTGYAYSGGNLNILTPLLTGEAGSVNRITAGGAINVMGTSAKPGTVPGLGGELSLKGQSLNLASAVMLPSGKLTLSATDDLTLADEALIDVAGRTVTFNDVTRYSAGGEVILQSQNGNIRQAGGSSIDLSARHNQAGRLSAVALGSTAGVVDLQGRILGSSTGEYDAGGTAMPYLAGGVEIQAQRLGGSGSLSEQFAALNQRLNEGQVFGSRGFQLKQGDLVIGDELKASSIDVSLDNGSLLVNGKVDASGERVGSIRLAAGRSLTLGGNAVLDAHGSHLRVDSYGKIIDSPNRAIVDLTSRDGVLTLADGARIDLRHGTAAPAGQHDGRARGTLELNARRAGSVPTQGDIAIDASAGLDIQGARSIAVNGTWQYSDAAYGSDPAASGRPYQVIDQAYLDGKHQDSIAFIDAALANGDLMQRKLAGLNNARYADAFHLRPGVEIVSATADGDLVVRGDLDLSGYRYASVNPHTRKTAVYGSGESGALTLRAGGDLNIYGSITDGFARPPASNDDKGWVLLPGIDFAAGDIVVPGTGVTLEVDTAFPAGSVLNFDVPLKGATLAAGTRLPVAATLDQPLVVPAGTVLAAAVHDAAGNLIFAAGTLLASTQTLEAGTVLGAGSLLGSGATIRSLIWPKGVALPGIEGASNGLTNVLRLSSALALSVGSKIPSGTDIKLPAGVESVQLRPEVAGSNWAIAPMLAEDSQSWSLRLVAGADTQAANSRVVQPVLAGGDLHLADSHYGMFGKAGAGGMVWTEEGAENFGDPSLAGKFIDFENVAYPGMCEDTPSFCKVSSGFVWTEEGAENFGNPGLVGQPIDFENVAYPGMCDDTPSFCTAVGQAEYKAGSQRWSVIRTGAADLELLSAGDLKMDSLYGVYTAGSSASETYANDPYNQPKARGAAGKVLNDALGENEQFVDGASNSLYRAWYPDFGGNLSLKVGGSLTGNSLDVSSANTGRPNGGDVGYDTVNVGNWLWRQGNGSTATGSQVQPTAWWINFGSYTAAKDGKADLMVGFTGFGTLGGGNLNVDVAGDAGVIDQMAGSLLEPRSNSRSQGLVLAVGSTGRVGADGSLHLTGGGDLSLRVSGTLNPGSLFTSEHLNGAVVNLRGHAQIDSGAIGRIDLLYGNSAPVQSPGETRAYDSFKSTRGSASGGLTLMPGDATFDLRTSGDLVVMDVADPGREPVMSVSPFQQGATNESGMSWFSLWTANTAIDLWSSGGNLTPLTTGAETDLAVVYPSILRAVAASGSLYYGSAKVAGSGNSNDGYRSALLLAPGINSELQFLAGDSIYGGELTVSRSGASSTAMATPFRPAFMGLINGSVVVSNLAADGNRVPLDRSKLPLFAFASSSASNEWALNPDPARFYALNGDLLAINSGRTMTFTTLNDSRLGQTYYEGTGPVWLMAGRDIVSSGTPLSGGRGGIDEVGNYTTTGNLFIHNNPTDISIVSAGRDILYSSFNVAGPGLMEITAGRNILMDDKVSITSIGAVVPGDSRPGASLVLQAGTGLNGADYQRFVKAYLDPANQALAGVPLASQDGKVAKTYEAELVDWLKERFGFSGDTDQARSFFAALPAEQQRVFARDVYFAELKAGGREYNEVGGVRQGSYLRGREAIELLFPSKDVAGNAITYKGDITMFGGAGVHTDFGGSIQMLTPGGGQTFGIEGNAPPSTAGVITQGEGDIQLYAQNSILLGQSRIMTTFGGSILGWSAQGDINAGRGSKTTVVYTPPKRLYDTWGNVTLSPSVPSTGAGIATLNPIAEVAPGDIDLIAPLGTIDAGEAGIRVSGNVNIAALTVVNAANIQTQGKSSGVPLAASVNTGAITSASSAASSATQAAEDVARQQQNAARQNQASVFTVQVVSFGSEQLAPSRDGASREAPRAYDPASPVQVLGAGPLDEQARQRLTEEERGRLSL
ncbi:hemagglutinin [Pseudomonas brassicacearum]|uniref:filamentous hemagglutinin family protein n=1 Tax=Pseudomonas brassicacearum TaxID=930166 RepID=UPI000F465B71|nr:filamentous hemagglutinin family protein [Pseudomonas brassicacearum]ROM69682.1 hemagglutinin [Pseudomonas brassicacearum]